MIISKQVYSFIKIVECGSFKKAADQSYISTSAIIQQMNLLEQELGVTLLKRTYRGISLTQAGEVFYSKMRAIVDEVTEARQLTVQAASASAMHVTLAFAQNLQYKHIYGLCQLYSKETGGVIDLVPLPYDEVLRNVTAGHYDGCFIQLGKRVRASGLKIVPFWIQKPALAVFKDHPLAAKTVIRIEDLKNANVVLPEYGLYDSTDTFYDEIQNSGVQARIVHITNLLESELYCREHQGVRLSLSRVIDPDMVMVPLETNARFTACLAYRSGVDTSRILSDLIRLSKRYCRETSRQEETR